MSRAGAFRHLPLVVPWLLIGAACGTPSRSLPAATPVTFETLPPATSFDATLSSDGVSTTSAVAPTTSDVATDSTIAATAPPTTTPPLARWVSATEGLVGLPSECGNMSLVSSRPDADMLITSIALQGLWASTDGVDTWSPLGLGEGSARITNRGSAIVFDPANPETFWESGTYNSGGVYRTDDGGSRFRQLGNLTHVEGISVDFTDPARRTLLATIHESKQTFRSADGGDSWHDLTSFLPSGIGLVSAALVVDDHTFLLGTYNDAASGVLLSTDTGETWTTVYDAGVIGKPLRANLDGALYWLLERVNGTIVSHDDGQTWALIPPKSEMLPTMPTLLELHDGSLASISNDRVVVSADQGASWTPVGSALPIAPAGIVYSPFRAAFYIWHFDCDFTTDNPILPTSIMRLDFDPTTP